MNSFNIIKTVRLTEKGTRQGEKFSELASGNSDSAFFFAVCSCPWDRSAFSPALS